jgi:hypothetical protein
MKYRALGAALLLALLPAQAFAASRVWISEFGTLGSTNSGGSPAQIATLPTLADQPVIDISGGVQNSAAFTSQTRYIQIMCEVQCAIKSGGTATTGSLTIPAGQPIYYGVQPLTTISVILNP